MSKTEAPDKPAPNALWLELSKTDPAHTKGFKRAGGFTGTAIKPMWVWQRLTEKFGPCGTGWGMDEPSFQVISGHNGEVLVYCTVKGWYYDLALRSVYGVGGDKVVSYIKANEQYKRPERWENDDEAFKKAYTDALMNAFKFVGVGADVHMGRFEDNKYVQDIAKEFAAEAEQEAKTPSIPTKLAKELKAIAAKLAIVGEVAELDEYWGKAETKATLKAAEEHPIAKQWLLGGEAVEQYGDSFVPLLERYSRLRTEMMAAEEMGAGNEPHPFAGG